MTWIALLAALVIGVPAAAWYAQDQLIFFPQPGPSPARLPPHAEPIEIVAADGKRLRGWFVGASRKPAPVLLYFGGNAEEVSWQLGERRWPRDWSLVLVNYRGYGESEGTPGEEALSADALAIYDAVVKRGDVASDRVVAFGRSLGSAVAIYLAEHRSLSGVVAVSPFDSLVALGQHHYPWLPVGLLLRHRFDSIARAQRLRLPLLAVVAESDYVIPLERSRRLFDAWAGPRTWLVVARTDHNSVTVPDTFWEELGTWLGALP